jgi:general secretion pathway protein C
VFAATGVNHFVEAKFLAETKESRPVSKVASSRSMTPTRAKTGDPIAKRNMFCSECVIEEARAEEAGPIVDSDTPPITSLPLRLVATNVSTVEEGSFATIQNTESEKTGAYWIKNTIPNAGEVVRINAKFVDFKNTSSRRVERISLLAAGPAPAAAKPKPAPVRGRSKVMRERDELKAAIEAGVRKSGDNAWEIDRSVVDKVLANPMAVGRGARIVPSIKNGKPNGFKLYAIRPSSVYANIGLMNGDTLHAVNGFELTTPDKALEVYTKVRESNSLSVNITRRGKPVTLNYSIK